MTKSEKYINELRKIMDAEGVRASVDEVTSGNYDENGNIINQLLPTITTDFCEIGSYQDICYFTIILKSQLFTKKLFNLIKGYPDIHIYGLKDSTNNYYPQAIFSYEEFDLQVHSEEYAQVQVNFDTRNFAPANIFDKYLKIKSIFETSKTKVINQLTDKPLPFN